MGFDIIRGYYMGRIQPREHSVLAFQSQKMCDDVCIWTAVTLLRSGIMPFYFICFFVAMKFLSDSI